jgi:hypothetical protein
MVHITMDEPSFGVLLDTTAKFNLVVPSSDSDQSMKNFVSTPGAFPSH